MSLLTAGTISLGVYLSIEILRYQKHLKSLRKIKNRIHVNGTRGKSSVTRLIYRGLKANPENIVVAKTTGTEPRFLFPDGKELPVARPGKVNIIEQLRMINRAVKLNANFFVTECMAITPEYIKIFEEKIMKSNVGVITNIREDHLDVMGPTIQDVAKNLCLSLPYKGIAFTCEERFFDIIKRESEKRKTEVLYIDPSWVNNDILEKFSYIEHKENVAIACAVCEHFGIERKKALKSMFKVRPDPGVLERYIISAFGKKLEFYSAFAANDPESTFILWKNFSKGKKTKIILFVLRSDRPSRTESFLKFLGDKIKADFYIVCGEHFPIVKSNLIKKEINHDRIITFAKPEPEDVFNEIMLLTEKEAICMGIGNIVGLGSKIKETFKARSLSS